MADRIDKTNAEHYLWGDGCDGWHLVQTDGLSVIQERMPPGTSEQKHLHKISRQFFYVLDGTATMEVDGRNSALTKNQGIEIPPNTPHRVHNVSSEDLSFLVVSSPKSHGDRVNL